MAKLSIIFETENGDDSQFRVTSDGLEYSQWADGSWETVVDRGALSDFIEFLTNEVVKGK